MNKFKSHFQFSKQQRSGIFVLILLIIGVQVLNSTIDFSSSEIPYNAEALEALNKEAYGLRLAEVEKRKPKLFPFNPNFITDYKGYRLGMSNEEIDRLLSYRAKDQWINSAKQFQRVTKISDSLLNSISPYFKFPEWVKHSEAKKKTYTDTYNSPKPYDQKRDLNTVTAADLKRVNGVGNVLSERIIRYRNKFKGGFIADVQLIDIRGLKPEVIERITNEFTVKTPRQITKLDLNTASLEELVTIQHIDYEVAHHIIEERTLREGFKSLEELTKLEDFPVEKYEIIKLYLQLIKQ